MTANANPPALTVDEAARASALLDEYVEAERIIAQAQARRSLALYGLAEIAQAQARRTDSDSKYEFTLRSMAAEVACATRVSDGAIRARMSDATTLVSEFPATFALFQEGRISDAHVRVIVAAGERLDDDDDCRAEYEAHVLRRAESLTPGALRTLARAVADRIEPLALVERSAEAMHARGVSVESLEDGAAMLRWIGSAAVIYGAHDRVTQMARLTMRTADDSDERSLDNVRSDTLADLVLTGHSTLEQIDALGGEALDAITATVQITIPVDTITGLGDDSAFLSGYGPIDPETAKRLAGGSTLWARLFTDTDTGCLRTVDGYVPTAAQKRFLAARDEHCRFPGCRQAVRRSEIDHTQAYSEGGATHVDNLSHLCPTHHRLKHNSHWQKRQGPDGLTEWISPLGRVYSNRPTPVVRFEALDEVAMPDLGREPAPF
ncbi:HNH endonuclease signature motif containing protein [Microbacterium rhizophilus]|uniref:HNH endonuclease signature motif containing protein n=1 Tax=Microbacterium rhizophilus TaxID=3138934 RepID=UPI0031E6E537